MFNRAINVVFKHTYIYKDGRSIIVLKSKNKGMDFAFNSLKQDYSISKPLYGKLPIHFAPLLEF